MTLYSFFYFHAKQDIKCLIRAANSVVNFKKNFDDSFGWHSDFFFRESVECVQIFSRVTGRYHARNINCRVRNVASISRKYLGFEMRHGRYVPARRFIYYDRTCEYLFPHVGY